MATQAPTVLPAPRGEARSSIPGNPLVVLYAGMAATAVWIMALSFGAYTGFRILAQLAVG
jgi:hypothetical protein